MNRLLRAASEYGWALALVIALGAFLLAWQAGNPVKEVHDHLAVPVAQSLGVVDARDCDVAREGDVRVPYCLDDGFIVWYDSEGNPTHKMLEEGGPFIFPGDAEW
jgi:hypothetical protein